MPLDGVVPFPADYAARYRERRYWRDRPLRDVLAEHFAAYADRIALHAGGADITYRQVDERAERLARNLYDLGLRPLSPGRRPPTWPPSRSIRTTRRCSSSPAAPPASPS